MAYFNISDPVSKITTVHIIKKPVVSIGSKRGNDVVIADPVVADTHLNIIKKGDTYTATILAKGYEAYLNGKLFKSTRVKFGDRLLVGRFELRLMEGQPKEDEPAEDTSLNSLKQLVDFSDHLMRDTDPEKVFTKLLAAVVELTRAEKGFIIVLKDGQRHVTANHNVHDTKMDISDSILNRVVESRKPLIISDAMNDITFAKAKSVVDLRLSSVMCVPLLYRDDLIGAIYLGNDSITDLFKDRDLALLQVFASQASLLVHTALMLNELKISNRNLRTQLQKSGQGEMIGSCNSMQSVFKMIRRIAPADISTLILGETGTGKELVAKELHRLSDRSSKPFISINCGAIPENLLESELFGHKRGSFTGAVSDKIGKFEAAEGGTIFLDEISEMPMNLQVKLLRVLQERTIERVGEINPRPLNIRVIAATNKDLIEEIKAQRFREDLSYRINEVVVHLPPLRERGEDILLLARFFLNKYAEQYNSKARGFTNDCIASMKTYYWPGNVRQLESRVKRAVIMSDNTLLNGVDLDIAPKDGRVDQEQQIIKPLSEAEEDFKLNYVREVLEINGWNKAQTARDLQVDPRTIFRYVEKLNA